MDKKNSAQLRGPRHTALKRIQVKNKTGFFTFILIDRIKLFLFVFLYRIWNESKVRGYVLDVVSFGSGFSCSYFDIKFNPKFPLAVLKFEHDLWIVLLPGKRRQIQGQILYRYRVDTSFWCLDSCQWSPEGTKLLTLVHTVQYDSVRDSRHDEMRPLIFLLDDTRGRYQVKELKNSVDSMPPCQGTIQLSRKLLNNFESSKKIRSPCKKQFFAVPNLLPQALF